MQTGKNDTNDVKFVNMTTENYGRKYHHDMYYIYIYISTIIFCRQIDKYHVICIILLV